jgi:hypothetical protein
VGGSKASLTGVDQFNEHLDAIDTVDVSGVISEVDTTKGCKSTEEVGLPGDWRLDMVDIGSGVETHCGRVGVAQQKVKKGLWPRQKACWVVSTEGKKGCRAKK